MAVMLALALLVVGGVALVNALNSDSQGGPPEAAVTADSAGTPGTEEPAPTSSATSRSASATPLVIRVVGAPTKVVVTMPETGEVLQQGVLNTGEERQYDKAPLQVVAADGGAVEVLIYGRQQPRATAGERKNWFVPARG
ncbi:hypothetical protein GCM10022416_24860 [Actinomadura keratinilytica]|uniref:DUF4115 domain-containing protein n=2 Tax=Actinomadura keratinilytica TaxID=547461 RepID=A0ABP7YPG7_9ACTN